MAIRSINNMKNDGMQNIQDLSWRHLRQANRSTLKAFQLSLKDSELPLYCREVVRIMPNKRLVAFGTWGQKAVVAKLFFQRGEAARHAKRDADGIKSLLEMGVHAPALLYEGTSADKRIHVLIFERLAGESLETLWQEKNDLREIAPLMHAVTLELATQHVLGILQHDLHFKNFIVRKKSIYTLDGGDIETFQTPLSKKASLDNLGLFFAQFGVGTESLQQQLFQTYVRARGWLVNKRDTAGLEAALHKWNHKRLEDYSKKIFRSSSAFVRRENAMQLAMYDRAYESEEFLNIIKNPESVFLAPDVTLLKAGRSSTVIKYKLANHTFVIKRYNIKNIVHGLRRLLRATRAAMGWRQGLRLRLLGVPTAKPVAFIEKSFLGMRGKSYLILEFVEGQHAGDFFAATVDKALQLTVAKKIVTLFENLAKLRITHGDLKATNILIAKQNPVLIDLDGMQEHGMLSGFKRAFTQEMQRFLENWNDKPSIKAMFAQLIDDISKRCKL